MAGHSHATKPRNEFQYYQSKKAWHWYSRFMLQHTNNKIRTWFMRNLGKHVGFKQDIHQYSNTSTRTKCPEIHGRHTNSIIKSHSTQIQHPFPLIHHDQTNSRENTFVYKMKIKIEHSIVHHLARFKLQWNKHGKTFHKHSIAWRKKVFENLLGLKHSCVAMEFWLL